MPKRKKQLDKDERRRLFDDTAMVLDLLYRRAKGAAMVLDDETLHRIWSTAWKWEHREQTLERQQDGTNANRQ